MRALSPGDVALAVRRGVTEPLAVELDGEVVARVLPPPTDYGYVPPLEIQVEPYLVTPGTRASGCLRAEATDPALPYPVGTAWYRLLGSEHQVLESLGSYVVDWARRRGVRTAMHRAILERWPGVRQVVTAAATWEGEAWLRAAGFRRVEDSVWSWVLEVPR